MYYKIDGTPGIQTFYEAGMLIGDTQGRIRGYEMGCRDGAMKKAKDVAKNLLAAEVSVETIASCVGLSIENVLSIAEKMSAPSEADTPESSETESETESETGSETGSETKIG